MNRAYLVAGVVLLAMGALSLFTVDMREKALKLQFGEIKRADYRPGLHFKWFWQSVLRFDARVQTLDSDPQLYLTGEKKQVIVDSFVKWKVRDVEQYYTSTGGNPQIANQRLSVVVVKTLRDEFGKRTVRQVVSGERDEIMETMRVSASAQADELGINIIDVRIKRVDLPEMVSQSVFDRMAAERKQVAKKFRSEGEEMAREIRAQAEREREILLAEAEREGQKIRGNGDAVATETYANAYGQDGEFYSLYRSLDAYRNTFSNPADILLLEPNTQFFRYFKDSGGGVAAGDRRALGTLPVRCGTTSWLRSPWCWSWRACCLS